MTSRSGKTYYLTSDPQQEVDHSVAVLLVDGFALGPRGGSARDARSGRRIWFPAAGWKRGTNQEQRSFPHASPQHRMQDELVDFLRTNATLCAQRPELC